MSKIMICDDDIVISQAISEFVKNEGYKTVIVNDSRLAIGMIENENFSIIITDYEMPNINGGEIIRYIKEKNVQVKKIMISGNDVSKISNSLLHDVYFIKKPIDFKYLLEVIKQ